MENKELLIPQRTIKSDNDLTVMAFSGNEGIGETWLIRMTYGQAARFFGTEDNNLPKREKLQREADKPRINNIHNYLVERDNTVFPSACLVVTKFETELVFEGDTIGVPYDVFKAVIPSCADRLFIDGQGRKGGIGKALAEKPELENHLLDVKVVVVNTETIYESAPFVRQIFSDFHLGLKKPNTSQNIYFDSEQPSSRLATEILDISEALGAPFGSIVAVDGKLEKGQVYTLANLTDFIGIMVGETNKKKLNKLLSEKEVYDMYLMLICDYIQAMFGVMPYPSLPTMEKADWTATKTNHVGCCAIGLKALAYFGRSLIEESLHAEEDADFSKVEKLAGLPLADRSDKIWIDKQIYQKVEDKLKIVKSSEKRLAGIFCRKARVVACEAL